jgi:hypothetical protein
MPKYNKIKILIHENREVGKNMIYCRYWIFQSKYNLSMKKFLFLFDFDFGYLSKCKENFDICNKKKLGNTLTWLNFITAAISLLDI